MNPASSSKIHYVLVPAQANWILAIAGFDNSKLCLSLIHNIQNFFASPIKLDNIQLDI